MDVLLSLGRPRGKGWKMTKGKMFFSAFPLFLARQRRKCLPGSLRKHFMERPSQVPRVAQFSVWNGAAALRYPRRKEKVYMHLDQAAAFLTGKLGEAEKELVAIGQSVVLKEERHVLYARRIVRLRRRLGLVGTQQARKPCP